MAQDPIQTPRAKTRIDPASLWRRYMAAFIVLAAVVIGGQVIEVRHETGQTNGARAINVSGQQRMLSQRMLYLSERYAATSRDRYANYLMRTRAQFLDNHAWLMSEAVPYDPDLRAAYAPWGSDLDARSRAYAELAWDVIVTGQSGAEKDALVEAMEGAAIASLLLDLDRIVDVYEAVEARNTDYVIWLSRITDAILLSVLFMQIAFVFYPAHRTLSGVIRRLGHQAWHDSLTGLLNRTGVLTRLTELSRLRAADRTGQQIVLIGIDLDGFKDVNDTLGHPAGDQVIRNVAQYLEDAVEAEQHLLHPLIGRMGGDEFLIAGLVRNGADASRVPERLCAGLLRRIKSDMVLTLEDGRAAHCHIGMSLGYATDADSGTEIDRLIADADLALYKSKSTGKGMVTRFTREMRAAADRFHQLQNDLEAAVHGMQFTTHFQPQVDLATGDIVSVEALARWEHPERGVIMPGEFLPIAEDMRLIDRIDRQVMDDAVLAMARFRASGLPVGRMGLNVSDRILSRPDFPVWLEATVRSRGLAPADFDLEVIENLDPSQKEQAKVALRALKAAGFLISIDDFGKASSSLSGVLQYAPHCLKVDRSLVSGVGHPATDRVLSAAVAMARGMGALILAEGIENWAEYRAIRALGFDLGQGFVIAKPMTAEAFTDYAATQAGSDMPFSISRTADCA